MKSYCLIGKYFHLEIAFSKTYWTDNNKPIFFRFKEFDISFDPDLCNWRIFQIVFLQLVIHVGITLK